MLSIFLFVNASLVVFAQRIDTLDIEFSGKPKIEADGSELSDTISIKFNLYKNQGKSNEQRVQYLKDGMDIQVNVNEYLGDDKEIKTPTYIEKSLRQIRRQISGDSEIPSDITISLLVDRSGSIQEDEMELIRQAVKAFVENVPDGCLFFSWFHDDISTSIPLTRDNFNEAELKTSTLNTALYNAIYTKLQEFDTDAILINQQYENGLTKNNEISKRNSVNNYLIVLTDGEDDTEDIPKYSADNDMEVISFPKLVSALEKNKSNVKVYTLGFGENSDNFDEEKLRQIAMASGNPNGYFLAQPDKIFDLLKVTITDEITPDYEIKLLNPKKKEYRGKRRTLELTILAPQAEIQVAKGSVDYAEGSTTNPFIVGKEAVWGTVLIGLITGVIFLLVVMIIIQLIIPLVKNKVFDIKHVTKYKPDEHEIRKECPYCGDPLNSGELVVVKCKHTVHKTCWGDYDHVCPEYGQNCNEGKQDYFDITDPFSRKNKIYYLNWVLYGLISGFLTWTIYLLLKDGGMIKGIAQHLVSMVSPNLSEQGTIDLFVVKIASLLLIGILMGFFLTTFFAYIEEYRRKNLTIMSRILLRGFIGGIAGFLSFYLGGIILIVLKQPYSRFLFDWIPWVIFGISLGLVLSVKTTISWKYGVLGGIISIIFGFIVLFAMVGDLGYNALLIGFMVYGAGLGFSIATVRTTAEQYFLKILQGKKHEETIPVHKWMSAQGGHNEVYIGKGFSCEIQMNWESNNHEIADRHAKLYINPTRNIPVLISLEKDKITTFDDRFEMDPGKEYDLLNGNTIKIGNTVFQYIEKDKN
jgi:hypothetical protein